MVIGGPRSENKSPRQAENEIWVTHINTFTAIAGPKSEIRQKKLRLPAVDEHFQLTKTWALEVRPTKLGLVAVFFGVYGKRFKMAASSSSFFGDQKKETKKKPFWGTHLVLFLFSVTNVEQFVPSRKTLVHESPPVQSSA